MTIKLKNQGSWGDVNVTSMLLDGKKMDNDVENHLTDAQLDRTIEGASTVTLNVYDSQKKLLTSGILASQVNIDVDMFKFSLVQVEKQGYNLNLTFEDWLVNQLRKKDKPIKAKRSQVTRAEFAQRLVKEIPGAKFVCPELHKKQPIAKKDDLEDKATKDENKSNGFPDKANLTVKGQKATKEQLDNADVILQVGKSMGADGFTQATAIATAIQESNMINLSGGDRDSLGLFQQRPSQGWGTPAQINDRAHASHSFFAKAIPNRKAHPDWTLTQLAQSVQISGFPNAYARWADEGASFYSAWSGDAEFAGDSVTSTKVYEFHRGGAGHKGENSWQCLQRLADEVDWRCYCIGKTIYFLPDRDLYKARPVDTISEDDEDIDTIDFDYDLGKNVTHATVQCHMKRWVAPPGSCIMVEKMGPVNGRWIVSDISRSLFNDKTQISLIKPRKALPEPRASSTTGGTKSTEGLKHAGPFGGDFVISIGRQYVPTPGAKGYVFGAHHGDSFTTLRDGDAQPPFDCSSFARFCWAKGGHVDIGGDTGGQIAHAKATEWLQGTGGPPPGGWLAGDLLFPTSHHVAIATGEGTVIQAANHLDGIDEKPVYTTVYFWCRPEPQA
jgi:hypothetical protein